MSTVSIFLVDIPRGQFCRELTKIWRELYNVGIHALCEND
jgi:hypothetical protein